MGSPVVKLAISVNGIKNTVDGMLSRASLVSGWLNRVGYPMLIESQRMRWASEGASEGRSWAPLNPKYAIQKLKRYSSYPGGGRKLLIATGRLVAGVTGDQPADHYKLVEEKRISVGTTIPYAKYVDEARSITVLSPQTRNNIATRLGEYIRTGKQ